MTIFRTIALLFSLTAATLGFAQDDLRVTRAEDKFIRPLLVVAPNFPKREANDKLPVEIRVSGTISDTGEMSSVEFSPAEGNEKFIQAINEVLLFWRFRPVVDDNLCAPVASSGVVLVWFEEKDGKPSVSVSVPSKKSEHEPNKSTKPEPILTLNVRPKVEYPRPARIVGMEGSAELLFQVNPQGKVLQTKVAYSVPDKAFGDAALVGARRTKFALKAANQTTEKNWCVVIPFSFCLKSLAAYPNPACAH